VACAVAAAAVAAAAVAACTAACSESYKMASACWDTVVFEDRYWSLLRLDILALGPQQGEQHIAADTVPVPA